MAFCTVHGVDRFLYTGGYLKTTLPLVESAEFVPIIMPDVSGMTDPSGALL